MPEVVDLYLRKSNADERRSVERQLADLTRDAESVDLVIGRVFVDPDLSASRFARKGRPDYDALVAHIEAGQCRVVGIAESSRGSRTLTQWSSFLDMCRSRKVHIWVQTHGRIYDLSRRRDWRTLADDGLDAADESEKISERALSGKRQAAVAGRPAGRALYGYLREYDERGRLVAVKPHPIEAPVVEEMIRRVAKGDPLRTIAAALNARGVTTPTGRPWRGALIRQSVLRPSYAGRRVHQGQDVGDAIWPPLVDLVTWRRAVAVLRDPGRRSTTRGVELAHWLTGGISCGACGQSMSYYSGGIRNGAKYVCECGKNYVSAPTLERVLEEAILARLAAVDAREAFVAKPDTDALQRASDALADLRRQADENERDYRAGVISAKLAGAREIELSRQIEETEVAVGKLSLPAELNDLAGVDVPAHWHRFSPTRKRAILRALAEIVVSPAGKRGPVFDPHRLDRSRWRGDKLTWGEIGRAPPESGGLAST